MRLGIGYLFSILRIRVPSSKSMTHREIIAAAQSTLECGFSHHIALVLASGIFSIKA